MSDRIEVDKRALHSVLLALIGQPHEVRELQATRGIGDNPIDTLVAEFNNHLAKQAQEKGDGS